MFTIKNIIEKKIELVVVENEEQNTKVVISPNRGSMISELVLAGESLLYLDKETFFDLNKNVRGGIPILFPICGALTEHQYNWKNKKYHMDNHGFARNMEWSIEETSVEENKAEVTLKLTSTQETLKAYPFSFSVYFTYLIQDNKLTIEQKYINHSKEEMPFYAGFHPYFKGNHKETSYSIPSTKRFDYHDLQWKLGGNLQPDYPINEAQVFTDLKKNSLSFIDIKSKNQINLSFGLEYKYIAVWSEKEKEYICVEPWMGLMDEMNKKENLIIIKPDEVIDTFFNISIENIR
ncbi:Aldose 1-epimerase [Mycobacteroides abscessus subsp. abscessus]|nr:Aldose 1-epimerase [Mycobacteroides abscessus subsp. abscessus]